MFSVGRCKTFISNYLIFFFQKVLKFLFYMKDRESERAEMFCLLVPSPNAWPQQPGLGQSEAQSPELNLDLPSKCWGLTRVSCHFLSPKICINRKLELGEQECESRHSNMECGNTKQPLNPVPSSYSFLVT